MSDWSSDVCSSDLERRPKIPVPLFPDPQAEVDIVEGDAQPFIQPADLVVYRCSNHHKRRGDRAQSLRQPRSMLMPGVSARSSRIARKSAVSGKSVSGRVDLGGRCLIKKNTL